MSLVGICMYTYMYIHVKIKFAVPKERRCKPWTAVSGFWLDLISRVQHNFSLALLGLSSVRTLRPWRRGGKCRSLWFSCLNFSMAICIATYKNKNSD